MSSVNSVERSLREQFIDSAYEHILLNTSLLTELDIAIGDGDHGRNMERGMTALRNNKNGIIGLSFPEFCKEVARILVMNIGGASGPLYAALVSAFGDDVDYFPTSRIELALMLDNSVRAVKKRGKSYYGCKTILDVLVPFSEAIRFSKIHDHQEAIDFAMAAAENTKPMVALKGRAAMLGKRSIGTIDPGAMSLAVLIRSICNVYRENECQMSQL